MPNFEAKEAQEFQRLYPEYNAGPEPEREPLSKLSDGTSCNVYFYRSRTDTVAMVTTPGFFNFMRSTFQSGLKKGVIHIVAAYLGEVADGLTRVDLHVVDAPSWSGGPVVMAVGRVETFEPAKADKSKAAA